MNANELADHMEKYFDSEPYCDEVVTMLRQQQTEIDRLNYDLDGFKQNFFVSGFHLQIKMANEQLLKQQEQIDFLKEQLEDCTCQGGHSQAYLKAKGKAQER
jgi:hypothetical protein